MSYGQATPYLPVIDLLRAYFKIGDHDGQRTVRERITGKLLALERAPESAASPLLALFDLPVDDPEWSASARGIAASARSTRSSACSSPEPHPAAPPGLRGPALDRRGDPALLDVLVERLPTARMLLLVDYRPGYRTGGETKAYTQLRDRSPEATSTGGFLHALLGPDPALDPLRRLLIDRTEGNPFFLEESVRALVETGRWRARAAPTASPTHPGRCSSPRRSRPSSPRASTGSPGAQALLQAAVVIGGTSRSRSCAPRRFDDDALRSALTELQATEFLYETRLFRMWSTPSSTP